MNLLPTDLKGTTDQLADEAISIQTLCASLEQQARSSVEDRSIVISTLTWLLDNLHRIPNGRQGRFHETVEFALFKILRNIPQISHPQMGGCVRIDAASRALLRPPANGERCLALDASEFPAEGSGSASAIIVEAYKNGWKQVLSFDWRGQRFCGSGLGPDSTGFRIDVYGNPGDYLASGLDGAEMYVHAAAQDQVAQIMKSGKLVIYGDVGQTFMYAAKGGDVYVLGNAAGRPLINAVGRPRVVINGTCLDYLAESFMAGDPLNGGGFVVVNGIRFNDEGEICALETPYPGGNLYSLASGVAIYVRDPTGKVGSDQLNGGQLVTLKSQDWELVRPYLEENQRLFGIGVKDLLKISERVAEPSEVFRKVEAIRLKALTIATE
jgi:glutamate synthase domain-containing protein 3